MYKRIVVISLILASIWYVKQNQILSHIGLFDNTDNLKTAQAYLPNIIKVSADQVDYLIKSSQNRKLPVLLYVYDSSCFLCRFFYEDITHFAKEYGNGKLTVLLLSLDEQAISLSHYLVNHPAPIRPLMLKEDDKENLLLKLQSLGSNFDGSIPQISIIEPNGKITDISIGFNTRKKISDILTVAVD